MQEIVWREKSPVIVHVLEWFLCIQWRTHTCFLRRARQLTQNNGAQVCCCFTTLRVLGDIVNTIFFKTIFNWHIISVIITGILCHVLYRQKMTQSGMMELYGDGFSMLKCISMLIVLIDVISKDRSKMPVNNESTTLADYQ